MVVEFLQIDWRMTEFQMTGAGDGISRGGGTVSTARPAGRPQPIEEQFTRRIWCNQCVDRRRTADCRRQCAAVREERSSDSLHRRRPGIGVVNDDRGPLPRLLLVDVDKAGGHVSRLIGRSRRLVAAE